MQICKGTSYEIVFIIRDNTICEQPGHHVLYTIRGNTICKGTSYEVLFTLRNDEICEKTSYNVLCNHEGNQLRKGTSHEVIATKRKNTICKGTGHNVLFSLREKVDERSLLIWLPILLSDQKQKSSF